MVLALFMPETRGISLEAIQDGFQVPKAGRQVQQIFSGLRFRTTRRGEDASFGSSALEMRGAISDGPTLSGAPSTERTMTPQRLELSVAA